ncbi:prolyl oligopeptidase family serine peptidase [Qipengyuania sp.]|uniref:S9 family peptidase n=1 Tax=Qipengyuania sp. TaxID=2004515 RepID=UPI0035C7FFCA
MTGSHGLITLTAGAFALVFATPILAQASGSRPAMSPQDLVTMPRLGGVAVSEDGQRIVYPVTTTDPQSYERTSTHYLRSLDPMAQPVKLSGLDGAGDARFAGDGWLYFLADAAEGQGTGSQVWRARIGANGAVSGKTQVTALPASVNGFAVAPQGDRLAVWGNVGRDCASFGCPETDSKGHLPGPGTGRLYQGDGGFIRHWDSWETPGIYSRVFVYDLKGGKATGTGMPADGPAGAGALVGDTPTQPFGGGEDVAFSADGKTLFFVARRADKDEPRSTNLDIWQSDLSGKAPVNLTTANEATDALPTPSPDGQYLAYVAMARPGYESDRQVVQLRDIKTGQVTALTEGFDRSFGSLTWTPDSRWLIATAQDVLDTPAFRIDPRTGEVTKLDLMAGPEAHIGNVAALHGDRMIFTRDSIGAPAELFLTQNWQQAMPLTDVATTRMGALAPTVTTRFSFAGANGDTVWGQITKPEGVGGKLPAILYVHGGPQGSFNDGWSSRWNPRVVASQGYAVISVDFHGSTGYGQAFTDSIRGDWGGKPLEDLKKGLAAALAKDNQIDGDRACAMGASYGGYMMNWIAGRWNDRFKCLVQHDGVFDARAMAYETEELWFDIWDHGGKTYFEDPQAYEKWNPVNYVSQWQTPMLVITGEKDFRIPYTQGIASFTALQMRDIPSQLLVFPDENHWVLKPKNSLQWHNTVFAWLDRWLKQ